MLEFLLVGIPLLLILHLSINLFRYFTGNDRPVLTKIHGPQRIEDGLRLQHEVTTHQPTDENGRPRGPLLYTLYITVYFPVTLLSGLQIGPANLVHSLLEKLGSRDLQSGIRHLDQLSIQMKTQLSHGLSGGDLMLGWASKEPLSRRRHVQR